MFELNDYEYSHMPFVAWSPNGMLQLCCLKVNDKWKVHYFEDGAWKKLYTGTEDDATECCPTAEWDNVEDRWNISFIAGGSTQNDWANVGFMLYRKYTLDNTAAVQVCPADVGYVFKDSIICASKYGPIYRYIKNEKMTIKLRAYIKFIYRLSYDPQHPSRMLISAVTKNDKVISFYYDITTEEVCLINDGDQPCYKCCFWNGDIYYCKKKDGGLFEERKIIKAEQPQLTNVKREMLIEENKIEDFDFEDIEEDE